ncbi:PBP1A family penicillin-binding protein [Lactobacillus jensenii]|uniref:PBP1A family penicillin-binding protein n=1 Tax=Lactobacillus jensenii TaxID=109790 RepID=UPI0029C1046E|nr:PBP1A family penicillin-binding protein [Lactobacillus jensenii]MDX5075893.1 PBP1A family penicillin-binding protein [Lactobacillus jensenii]MDX5094743.1 PBP1A family penicillin-binding protein [Lactobacillus jensenii]MDX5102856.1 PBP1A family penicillin-binding protein [Lactobacillus jensenii]MDX5104433.1 PBP1A family penicillin-binding protein [Lactobacillus jensenii]MDX5111765.1 PBP1A family penicillin-binding protein [Lactobacillus jensenii]
MREYSRNKKANPVWLFIKNINHRFQVIRWLVLALLTVILITSSYYTIKVKTSNIANLKASLATTTQIYDASGQKAGNLYSQKGTFVELDKISPYMQEAVISTEDRTFYTNPGFSIKGMARAFVSLLIHHGNIAGGGSTLTQQLAKNAILTQQQTFSRKLEELFFAIEINHVYSKKDILTMYLNNAYFGNGVWGVQDASHKYFGKDASDLTVGEAATLAGMLRNPSYYNPIDHMTNALSRRNVVLGLMVQNKKLSASSCKIAQSESLSLKDNYTQDDGYKYPYFFDAVVDEAISKYGLTEEDVMNKGLKIYTTLNTDYQSAMQDSFDSSANFPASASDGTKVQGASVAVDPKSGAVRAIVGGRGEHVFRGYNRATQIKRQPGSSIKPLAVYTPALQNGYHYDSELSDKLQTFGSNKYEPHNVDNQYSNSIPMYQAIAQSKNVAAVWLLDKIGVAKGVQAMQNFGIKVAKRDQNLALALGGLSTGVSPLQMAKAYSAFANNGNLPNNAYFITKIEDASGNVIAQNSNTGSHRIMSQSVAKEMTSMLLGVFTSGTAQSAQPSGYQVAGKTGSTEVSWAYGTKDQWIVGYTPDVVVATWVGFDKTDQNHYMQGISETGITRLYKAEMEGILPYTKGTAFSEKPAQSMANSTGSDSDWLSQAGQNLQNGLNQAGKNIQAWYNNIKGLFGK